MSIRLESNWGQSERHVDQGVEYFIATRNPGIQLSPISEYAQKNFLLWGSFQSLVAAYPELGEGFQGLDADLYESVKKFVESSPGDLIETRIDGEVAEASFFHFGKHSFLYCEIGDRGAIVAARISNAVGEWPELITTTAG